MEHASGKEGKTRREFVMVAGEMSEDESRIFRAKR